MDFVVTQAKASQSVQSKKVLKNNKLKLNFFVIFEFFQ
jgi:hypothetical protein